MTKTNKTTNFVQVKTVLQKQTRRYISCSKELLAKTNKTADFVQVQTFFAKTNRKADIVQVKIF